MNKSKLIIDNIVKAAKEINQHKKGGGSAS